MSVKVRSELSKKNKYWIERHRYYELKHFCLQYPIWKKAYAALDGFSKRPDDMEGFSVTNVCNDPTAKCAIAKAFYSERMDMVERAAMDTDEELSDYILEGVTNGVSYEHLKARLEIPCGKDTYYDRYRRFFWILNKERQ